MKQERIEIIYGDKEKRIGILPHQLAAHKALFLEGKRFILEHSGIRGGKTYDVARKAMLLTHKYPGELGWLVAPTYKMTRPLQSEFEKVLENNRRVLRDYSKAERVYKFVCNSVVEVRSAEDPEHLKGPAPKWIAGDELSLCQEKCWHILRGRVASTNGIILISTTPRGKNWVYYDLFLKAKSDPKWYAAFSSPTSANPCIPKEELEDLYNIYRGDFARQELEAQFISFEGQIYHSYNPDEHTIFVDPEVAQFDNIEVIGIGGLDFGWDPDPSVYLFGLLYKDSRGIHLDILEEIYDTQLHMDAFAEEIKKIDAFYKDKYKLTQIQRYSDPSCPRERMDLTRHGVPNTPAPKPYGGSVREGIELVYSWFERNMIRRHSRCINLDMELSMYSWKVSKERKMAVPMSMKDHACSALRYMIECVERQKKIEKIRTRDVYIPQRKMYSYR